MLDCFGETANTFLGYIAINAGKKGVRHSINGPFFSLLQENLYLYTKKGWPEGRRNSITTGQPSQSTKTKASPGKVSAGRQLTAG